MRPLALAGLLGRPLLEPCPKCRRPTRTAARLCWRCRQPLRFANTSKHAFGRGGDVNGGYAAGEPTTALPGTPEKVAVLEERARLRLALFHPGDA